MTKALESQKGAITLQSKRRKGRARRPRRRPQFSYLSSLAHTQDFRLLELIPAPSLKADMHCRLWRYPLSSSQRPLYDALSYTWGDACESRPRITLDGSAFFITASLLGVLRRLRRQRRSRLVWVDAICINQESNKEKNTQVPLMGQIYSSAASVLVWLGEASFDSGSAIDAIPMLTEVASNDAAELWLERLGHDDFLRKVFSLAHFFHRPWWSRKWVIQEVALAKQAIVLCGERRVPWLDIYTFVTTWMNITFSSYRGTLYNSYSEPEFGQLQHVALRILGDGVVTTAETLSHMRQQWQAAGADGISATLSNLLWSLKNAQASNPRDKIYGLLGLARRLDRDRIKVDYSLSVESLYSCVFRFFLLDDNSLDSFRWMTGEAAVAKRTKATGLALPSWVPDFGPRAISPISSFAFVHPGSQNQRLFAASGLDRSRSRWKLPIQFDSDGQILLTTGRVVDTIRHLGQVCPSRDDLKFGRHSLKLTISAWRKLARKTGASQYSGSLEDAFWRTVLAD